MGGVRPFGCWSDGGVQAHQVAGVTGACFAQPAWQWRSPGEALTRVSPGWLLNVVGCDWTSQVRYCRSSGPGAVSCLSLIDQLCEVSLVGCQSVAS